MAKKNAATAAAEDTRTPAPAPAVETEAAETVAKSIINSKYRGKYNAASKDWLARFIDTHATAMKDVKVTETKDDAKVTSVKQVPDGVDVDKLHSLARKNGLDIDALAAQSETHGYPGRARMTIRNMLQTVAKQRHGLHGNDSKFHDADADFLAAKGAPDSPSHDQAGAVIPKAPQATEATKETAAA